jgi:hypothetical protein
MTVFKLQVWLDAQNAYDGVQSFSPDYVWTVEKIWRHWYCPWPRIEIGVIENMRPAELKAARIAILYGRIRRRKQKVRVMRVTEIDGKETKTVVWDNGKYLDTTILPWYWRLLRWIFVSKPAKKTPEKTPEKKPEKK